MVAAYRETVLDVHHWSPRLFTIKTTRPSALRFRNGEFVMLGLEVASKPLLRAYSMTSANHDDYLEFYSIKVADGALTSRLQHIEPGDTVLVSKKPTGSLLWENLRPGKYLYLLATGTGLAPFLSVIKDPDLYTQFAKIILVHGCRYINELSYQRLITHELHANEYFGECVKTQLLYYPAVTREPYKNHGRITELLASGRLSQDLGLPPHCVADDRFMLCGSSAMLKQTREILHTMQFRETRAHERHEYVIERAFVEK